MPVIPLIETQEDVRVGGIDVYANADQFGAQIGRAIQGLGQSISSIGGSLKAKEDKEEARQRDAQVATIVANAEVNIAKSDEEAQLTSPPDTLVEDTVSKQRKIVADTTALIKDDVVRQRVNTALIGNMAPSARRAASHAANVRAQEQVDQANAALNGLQNMVLADPSKYDTAVTKGHDVVNSQPGMEDYSKKALGIAWEQRLAHSRFNGMLSRAKTIDDYDAIKKELVNPANKWDDVFKPEEFKSVIDTVDNAKIQFAKVDKAQLTSEILSARERTNAMVPMDSADLDRITKRAEESGDEQAVRDVYQLRADQKALEISRNVPARDMEARAKKQLETASGSRGFRNNNPGNIEYGNFAKGKGATGTDGRFAKFDTPEQGVQAMAALLRSYQGRGLNTVRKMIDRWNPKSDGQPSDYIPLVAGAMGVDPDTPFDFVGNPELAARMMAAMIKKENGKNPYSVADIQAAMTGGTFSAAGTGNAPSDIEWRNAQYTNKLAEAKRKGEKENPAGQYNGIVQLNDLDAENGFRDRAIMMGAAANLYGIPMEEMKPFDVDTELDERIKQFSEGNTEEKLALMQKIQTMEEAVPGMAKGAYAQLGMKDTVFEHAAVIANSGAAGKETARTIIEGQQRLEADKTGTLAKAVFTTNGSEDTTTLDFIEATKGSLFGISPASYGAIFDATKAYYAETTKGKFGYDPVAFKAAASAVIGGGGVGNVNGKPTVLPPGVTENEFNYALDVLTDEEYEAASLTKMPPIDVAGQVVSADDIADEGEFVYTGGLEYMIRLTDGKFLTTGERLSDGGLQPYVFVANVEKIKTLGARSYGVTEKPIDTPVSNVALPSRVVPTTSDIPDVTPELRKKLGMEEP